MFTDFLEDIEHGKALWTVGQGPHHVFAYEAPALEWVGKLVLVPLQNEQGETGARIILYGGICSVSQHKEEAFQMLRLLFDGTFSESSTIPVKKAQFDSYMDSAMMSMRSSVENSPLANLGKSVYHAPVDDIWFEQYRQWVENAASATLDSLQYQRIYDLFKPYFNGRRSFDQCVADSQNYYSIYVSE